MVLVAIAPQARQWKISFMISTFCIWELSTYEKPFVATATFQNRST